MNQGFSFDETPEELVRRSYARGQELGRKHRRERDEEFFRALSDDERRLEHERLTRGRRHCPTPADVFKAATDSIVVNHFLQCWRSGFICWEEALAGAVIALAEQNQQLTRMATNVELLRTPSPVKLDG